MVKVKLLHERPDPHPQSDSLAAPAPDEHGIHDMPEVPRMGDHVRLDGTEYPVKSVVWTPGELCDVEVTVGI